MIVLVTEEIHFASGAELFSHVGKLVHVGLVLVQASCVGKFSFAAFMEALDKLHLASMSLIRDPSSEFLKIYLNIENVGLELIKIKSSPGDRKSTRKFGWHESEVQN